MTWFLPTNHIAAIEGGDTAKTVGDRSRCSLGGVRGWGGINSSPKARPLPAVRKLSPTSTIAWVSGLWNFLSDTRQNRIWVWFQRRSTSFQVIVFPKSELNLCSKLNCSSPNSSDNRKMSEISKLFWISLLDVAAYLSIFLVIGISGIKTDFVSDSSYFVFTVDSIISLYEIGGFAIWIGYRNLFGNRSYLLKWCLYTKATLLDRSLWFLFRKLICDLLSSHLIAFLVEIETEYVGN